MVVEYFDTCASQKRKKRFIWNFIQVITYLNYTHGYSSRKK
jgi:hypothetical protein